MVVVQTQYAALVPHDRPAFAEIDIRVNFHLRTSLPTTSIINTLVACNSELSSLPIISQTTHIRTPLLLPLCFDILSHVTESFA